MNFKKSIQNAKEEPSYYGSNSVSNCYKLHAVNQQEVATSDIREEVHVAGKNLDAKVTIICRIVTCVHACSV